MRHHWGQREILDKEHLGKQSLLGSRISIQSGFGWGYILHSNSLGSENILSPDSLGNENKPWPWRSAQGERASSTGQQSLFGEQALCLGNGNSILAKVKYELQSCWGKRPRLKDAATACTNMLTVLTCCISNRDDSTCKTNTKVPQVQHDVFVCHPNHANSEINLICF